MCGIVGYVGENQCAPILVRGLRKLEYRGYDSSGIAVLGGGELRVLRAKGKLTNLEALLATGSPSGTTGIGHTRWATHGRPTDANAHPHRYADVAVVHNGIVENYLALKAELRALGHVFSSDTDTEVIAHLVAVEVDLGRSLEEAVRRSVARLRGTYAVVVTCARFPGQLVATKTFSPLVVCFGKAENYVASDVPAFLDLTRDFTILEEGDLAVLTKEGVRFSDRAGERVQRPVRRVDWTPLMAEKGGHKHFMHKEIHEQSRALADTLRGRILIETGDVELDGFPLGAEEVQRLKKVFILACGTSWHAALVGKTLIETLARIPVEVYLASEFRYRDPLVGADMLSVAISQSGETADTLAALRESRRRGATWISISNVLGSSISRESEFTLYTHAGPEIGVASTKCFTTQLAALYLLAVKLGRLRGTLTAEEARGRLASLQEVPQHLVGVLAREEEVKAMARGFAGARDALFLGRGVLFPVALEGALKLKEVSYLHAEGYAAGEMKHGPIALIDEGLPIVVVAPHGSGHEKMMGTVEEARARGGSIFSVLTEGDEELASRSVASVAIPRVPPLIAPILAVVPLQLLAYHVADARGTDVDQPRNLAKSVTVE